MEKINESGYVRVYLFRKHDHVIPYNKVTQEKITPHNNVICCIVICIKQTFKFQVITIMNVSSTNFTVPAF